MNLSASDIASTAAQLFYLNTDIREIQCCWYSKVLGLVEALNALPSSAYLLLLLLVLFLLPNFIIIHTNFNSFFLFVFSLFSQNSFGFFTI